MVPFRCRKRRRGFWRQIRAFAGPAFLVSVGYMDPGNWGTDLEAGAKFKYDLLWVVAAASFMAIIMQVASARLGVVTGKDLAQACRDWYPAWTRWPNWLVCEAAIAACDLAEVLGSAVAIHLLFGVPLFWAVIITAFDVLLLLALQGIGMRFIEAIILVLVSTIAGCYFLEIFVLPQTHPDFLEMGQALLTPGLRRDGMIGLAIAIIGATVMPHNLYLHSALVQSRQLSTDEADVKRAIRFNTIDTVVALSIAFVVNAAILVLAAVVFYDHRSVVLPDGVEVLFNDKTDWLGYGHLTLAAILGTTLAGTLFAVALLASGQSSTITGTLAGQVVMEGFMHWRIKPWLRRLLTPLARDPAGDSRYLAAAQQQSNRSDCAQPGSAGLAVAARDGAALAFHEYAAADGRVQERLVPPDRWLDFVLAHHRPRHLRPARSPGRSVASDRGHFGLSGGKSIQNQRNKIDDHQELSMKGNPQVIDALNRALTIELTAINQYFCQAKMCMNWGYKLLGKKHYEESMGEMKHAEKLIDRILFLDGTPEIARYDVIRVGTNVKEQFENDLKLEMGGVNAYNATIELCTKLQDNGSRELVAPILVESEEHVDWLETQLALIDAVGLQNYLTEQMGGHNA